MLSFVGNKDSFKERSNKRATISLNDDRKMWCATHPSGFWGYQRNGQPFTQCTKGYRLKEKCILGE